MRKWINVFFFPFLCLVFISCSKKEEQKVEKPNAYRLEVDSLIEVHGTIEKNQTLSDILLPHGVTSQTINKIEQKAKDIFPVSSFKTGDDYYIYAKWDTVETLKYFIYVRNEVEYVVFDLRDSVNVYHDKKDVKLNERIVSGIINNSLWETFESLNIEPEVAIKLADIYACQIDFFKIQQSDSFKVVYEETLVEDKPVGVGKIMASNFYHAKENYYAFRFEKNNETNYYDEKGNSLKKAFLKAPLKFSRISSRYSLKRFHPVLGRNKAHLGTDYAAPTGTPIMSVGNGTILEAQFKKFNGNYVKISHNKTYTTQYLHMSKIAKGMRKGIHVKQGQIIGYVGSTGLATGPHVCFRFWKNGKQVDPLKEKTVSAGPVAKKDRKEFLSIKDYLMTKLISSIKESIHSSKS
jgi:murein DD-endopeptidase MepM/ murein hydrolase activator NlpD